MATYLDDFMDKMITVPNDVNRFSRLIRKLDKRAEDMNAAVNAQQMKIATLLK
jgi:ribosomal protein S17